MGVMQREDTIDALLRVVIAIAFLLGMLTGTVCTVAAYEWGTVTYAG